MSFEFWKFWKNKFRQEKGEDIVISNGYEFPCSSDECLVRMACTKACDKIEMDDNNVMKLFLRYNGCPDCGSEKFMEGPAGGGAQNIKCRGCGHWFNVGLPLFIQRIHINSNGVFR